MKYYKNEYNVGDRVRVIGIGNGEVEKIRLDTFGDAIYTVKLYDGTTFYARDVELLLEVAK